MREFHLTPREAGDPTTETRLAPDELIVGYRIPTEVRDGQAYVKIRERASYEYAIVSAAATVVVAGGRDRVGAGGARIGRPAAVAADRGRDRAERRPAHPRSAAPDHRARERRTPIPLPHNGFKVAMARNAAVRALLAAGGAR